MCLLLEITSLDEGLLICFSASSPIKLTLTFQDEIGASFGGELCVCLFAGYQVIHLNCLDFCRRKSGVIIYEMDGSVGVWFSSYLYLIMAPPDIASV